MDICRPTLILDQSRCRENIRKMAMKASVNNLVFRPHFKTHQSAVIGEWFREFSVTTITVSSVSMAGYFADAGWNDITIAFPVNTCELPAINRLGSRVRLNLLVVSPDAVKYLSQELTCSAGIFIEIDTGYHRTGLLPQQVDEIREIIGICESSSRVRFMGFLCHAGQTYSCHGKEEIGKVHRESLQILGNLKKEFGKDGGNILVSYGDTPSCSLMDDFPGVDEIRPGNFVFYDLMQYFIGSCSFSEIALIIACPVVAKHPSRSELVVYGGAVHLSKESLLHPVYGTLYGLVVNLTQNGWTDPLPGCFVRSLSQEHGVISVSPEIFRETRSGTVIGIVPVHSCLAVSAMTGNPFTGAASKSPYKIIGT
jgi:D-serine deaminase-like pyridoxal phosphate-dependent protein